MMDTLLDLLKKNPVFSKCPPSDMDELVRLGSRRSYSKGENVILYGEIWPYLFLVEHGEIEAMKESGEGRILRVTSFGTGDLFWGLAFFQEDAPMPVTL